MKVRLLAAGAVAAVAALVLGVREAGQAGRDDGVIAATDVGSTTDPTSGTTTSTESAPMTTAPPRSLLLQVVPPVRDVRVRVGDRIASSDAAGLIRVPDAAGATDIVVLGYLASPAIEQVRFLQWSDGSPEPVRQLDVGVLPDIEVEVLHRVVVRTDSGTPPGPLTFESDAGRVTLIPGEPAWVPARRPDRAGLLNYVLIAPSGGAPRSSFVPTPEAAWSVGTTE